MRSGSGLNVRVDARRRLVLGQRRHGEGEKDGQQKLVHDTLVLVLHPAVFADSEAFAILQQLLEARLLAFTGFQALGGGLVGCCHDPVALGVLLLLLVTVLA